MEKTLTIDGREVRFKATAGFLYRYRTYFGIEYYIDLAKISVNAPENKSTAIEDYENIDTRVFERILWTYAKTADDTIPEIDKWLDGFEVFNAKGILNELTELLEITNKSLVKN